MTNLEHNYDNSIMPKFDAMKMTLCKLHIMNSTLRLPPVAICVVYYLTSWQGLNTKVIIKMFNVNNLFVEQGVEWFVCVCTVCDFK